MWRSLLITCLASLSFGCGGPLGPFAGGKLSGDEVTAPVTSWAFAENAEVIQLETQPSAPHSINIWSAVVEDQLYVPTSLILGQENPTERDWVQHVSDNPAVRVRIDGNIYRANAARVSDPARITGIKSVLLAKYEEEATEHSDQAWIFELQPR